MADDKPITAGRNAVDLMWKRPNTLRHVGPLHHSLTRSTHATMGDHRHVPNEIRILEWESLIGRIQLLRECAASGFATLVRARAARLAVAGVAMFANVSANADPLFQHPVIRSPQPVSIALPDFLTTSPADVELGRTIARIVTIDLKQNGVFVPIDQSTFVQKNMSVDTLPEFADWRASRTQELVVGRITRQPDSRIRVDFRLWDVSSGEQLVGQQYIATPDDLGRIGHMISEAIYKRVTGEQRSF